MPDLFSQWRVGLSKTSKAALGRLSTFFGASEITKKSWIDLEELLIQADLGMETTNAILGSMRKISREKGITSLGELQGILENELESRLLPPPPIEFPSKPAIILLVGVNGSGKTTTAAKLGYFYACQEKKVLLVAADTFRAAAVDQLQIWANRVNLPVVSGQMGSDPAAVVYDSLQSAQGKSVDLVLIDTAGRIHTRYNLMEELGKIHRVIGKALPGAPHAVWLVLDATTGQNALVQARVFQEIVKITGIILTKLDLSARGGMAFAIQQQLGLPILFAGLGERNEDLVPFDPRSFVKGILGKKT